MSGKFSFPFILGSNASVTPNIGLSIQGEWNPATAYTANQIVTYNGSSYYAVIASTGTVPGTDATQWGILALGGTNGQPGVPGGTYGAALLTGGYVFYTGSGLIYTITAATYVINGVVYSSAQTNVTLTTADVTNPRIDAFALTSSSTAIKVDGTAAANPAEASVDPLTQLKIGTALIAAGATTATVGTTSIYAENIEWTSSVSGAPMNAASTSNPHAGTKDIEATSAVAGNYVQLTNSVAFDTATRNVLAFYIRSKAAWPSAKSLLIQWNSAGVAKGTPVTLKTGAYGFNSGTVGSYQLILVPLSAFGVAGVSVDGIRFTVTGGSSAIGFYLDDISMQGGIAPVAPSDAMRWKDTYSSAVQYVLNDVVMYLGTPYIARQSLLGIAPTGTGWTALRAPFMGARALRASVQTLTSGATTALLLDNEASPGFDTDSIHSTVTNTSRFTVPAGLPAQYWMASGSAEIQGAATGVRFIRFKVNGTDYPGSATGSLGTSAVNEYLQATLQPTLLQGGDYIELYGFQNSGGNLDYGDASIGPGSICVTFWRMYP